MHLINKNRNINHYLIPILYLFKIIRNNCDILENQFDIFFGFDLVRMGSRFGTASYLQGCLGSFLIQQSTKMLICSINKMVERVFIDQM